ncbi:hypothetical protein GGS23DRAFT_40053 [Durotheca rogersii]|uniref:uncharacterized protein n=1 Tax=Durotheca rogersii TaxID=419775 RepID=UPI00222048AC|nr:uncharacterized protein GGS23DRAFT_40053 [Durotheca rogersii]KAI5868626.1 hypothetical protein GGS23DRAFT_40053 [Durotheca rogersii]
MAAPADLPSHVPPPPLDTGGLANVLKNFLGKGDSPASPATEAHEPRTPPDASPGLGPIRKTARKVVPGLPRAKTFKRQQSELRDRLEAVEPTSAERRAVSVDRRLRPQRSISRPNQALPHASAPDFLEETSSPVSPHTLLSLPATSAPQTPEAEQFFDLPDVSGAGDVTGHPDSFERVSSYANALSPTDEAQDAQSMTTSQYDDVINAELERKWILNLSMHFRDKSRREKFFVTYREDEYVWRRVTISLDYRDAPNDSLEKDLLHIKYQREKSAKIYEAIRDSLRDIQFYSTVTNLKLQTTDGRLHVHVVEDVNEIINYPDLRMVQHLRCRRIKERDLVFDSHMSGFVYKVRVAGQTLIKKEIPGPDTVDEFLYEVNALNSLRFSQNVIEFYGVVVDDDDRFVKGLLINYAEKGTLIDMIYDSQEEGGALSWARREKWARQIVQGLSDVHEAGFVQGDLTLSNIVIDDKDNAKIIDINRRGCPVGWEPPEATPLIDSNQRISMYIGVKSDLYQLGMVLWALATSQDEPEAHPRPLRLDPQMNIPEWYRSIVECCLHENPRARCQATEVLTWFPKLPLDDYDGPDLASISVDDGHFHREYTVGGYQPNGHRTVQPRDAWSQHTMVGNTLATSPSPLDESHYYPSRGRSPPRSLPDDHGNYGLHYDPQYDMWPNDVMDLPAGHAGIETGEAAETTGAVQGQFEWENDQVTEAEEIETPLPFSSIGTEAVAPTGEPATTAPLREEGALEGPIFDIIDGRPKQADFRIEYGIRIPTESGDTAGLPNSGIHDGEREKTSTRATGAPLSRAATGPRSHDVPAVLTGIGSAYEKQEEFRQATFSDEDLGLLTTTNAAPRA